MKTTRRRLLLRYLVQIGAVLAVAGGGALYFAAESDRAALQEASLTRARAHFRGVATMRSWNAAHGGVYVEKRPGVESNPYLDNPDVTTTDGRVLTLRNPALMTREVAEMAARDGDFRFNIASLTPKNPKNIPDGWERAALQGFAGGDRERYATVIADGRSEFRYMAPLMIEPACRTCHAAARVGDIAGGISVRFDTTGLVANAQRSQAIAAAAIALTLGAVFAFSLAFARRLAGRMQRLVDRQEDLMQSIDGIVWEAEAETMRFTFISRQAERILGYPLAEWQKPGFWTEHLHPDDRERAAHYLAATAGRVDEDHFEYRFIARDGRTVWLHDVVATVAEDGRPDFRRGLMLDVTARKKQEEEAQRLLLEKETILHNALVGIVYVRNEMIVSCNRRFAELFGYAPDELTGAPTAALYAAHDDYVAIGERAYRAIARGENYTQELLLRRRDGRAFWGAINGRAADPAHPHDGSIWIYADISKRRQAEEQVHKLTQAVEQSPVSILITNPAGVIEYVNPRFTRVTGYTAAEAVGRTTSILKSGETAREIYAELWETILAGREWRGVLRNRRKDGELFWEEASISPILGADGEITHFLAVKEDISERKRAEDALRDSQDAYLSLLATTLDGFWLLDRQGRLLDANASYVRQSGYPREELLRMSFPELEAAPPAESAAARLRRVMDNGSAQFETVHRRRNGALWHVEVSVSYRAARGGQFFVFLRDIGARKRIQQELEEHQAHLEDMVARRTADLAQALAAAKVADAAKDAFLANVSHELRTPLNAVIGLSGLARKASADPRQREYLDKIADAGQTLLGVINDLLDLSKIAAGELHFESVPFSLRQVVARVRSLMAHRAAEKGLRLEEAIDPALPDVLVGDPLRVEQILINLINNAIKFTEHGRIAVRIAPVSSHADRVGLGIEVEDSGIGMDAAAIEHLFQPFAQADASITRRYGGTGLGLAICKRLAEGMNGGIEVASQPGRGTTFRVRLDLGLGRPGDLAGDAADAAGDLPTHYANARVLLVDDQPLNREVVFELLATVGIVPQMAGNGREAVDQVLAAGPSGFDLVLMDIQMPVMDGLSATREIRARDVFAGLPIVAMTAHAMEHEKAVYLAAGMNDHIGKPFNLTDFFRLLARWLTHRAAAAPTAAAATPAAAPAATPAAAAPAAAAAPTAAAETLPPVAGLDAAAALERFAGSVKRYRHWLEVFVDEAAGFAGQVGDALAAGRNDEARKAAHAFKGRAGMLGMTALHRLAGELEQAIAGGTATGELLAPLATAIDDMRSRLQAALAAGRHDNPTPAPAADPSTKEEKP